MDLIRKSFHGRPERRAQVAEPKAAGCEKVFKETASGAKTDRTQLKKAIASLGRDDVLIVTRLGWRGRAAIC
jgi:DNA invertase Pin-like site-specific DNA recombinase